MTVCWICREDEANSGEHKWPSSVMRRIPDDWSELVHGRTDGTRFHTQGPNSQNLKQPVLCLRCNNQRTQRQDRALDAFLRYVLDHEEEVWTTRRVPLNFSPDHAVLDLYRAFLKLEFSRFHADGVPIAPAVADFVAGGDDWIAANGFVRVQLRAVENFDFLGLTYPWETDAPLFQNPLFITNQIGFGWFSIHYVYAPEVLPELPWPLWDLDVTPLRSCVLTEGLQPVPLL